MAPDPLEPGDTVTWKARNGTRAWGLVAWTGPNGVHVQARARVGDHARRYLVPWEKVTGHYHGRAEHDRHM